MLVIKRRFGESVVVNGVLMTVIDFNAKRGEFVLGFDGKRELPVDRLEVYEDQYGPWSKYDEPYPVHDDCEYFDDENMGNI